MRFIMSYDNPAAVLTRLKFNVPTIECFLGKIYELRGCATLTAHEQIDILGVFFSTHRDALKSGSRANTYRRTATLLIVLSKPCVPLLRSGATNTHITKHSKHGKWTETRYQISVRRARSNKWQINGLLFRPNARFIWKWTGADYGRESWRL